MAYTFIAKSTLQSLSHSPPHTHSCQPITTRNKCQVSTHGQARWEPNQKYSYQRSTALPLLHSRSVVCLLSRDSGTVKYHECARQSNCCCIFHQKESFCRKFSRLAIAARGWGCRLRVEGVSWGVGVERGGADLS